MDQKINLPKPSKPSPTAAFSPIADAALATMPIVYSTQIAVQQQSGPLPAPEILRKYEDISPGLVNRIVAMAESESAHRRSIEASIVEVQGRDQLSYRKAEILGLYFGLIIGLSAIASATYVATHGAPLSGAFIGTAGVTGLVSAFILGRSALLKMRKQELDRQQTVRQQQLTDEQIVRENNRPNIPLKQGDKITAD